MTTTPTSAQKGGAGPGTLVIHGLNLAILSVLLTHLLAAPGVLAIITGFVMVVTLPVLMSMMALRAVAALVTMADTAEKGLMSIPIYPTPTRDGPTDSR